MTSRNIFETVLGAIILLVAVCFVVFAYQATAGNTGGLHQIVNAYFDRVDGIVVGTDVKISGVKVGTVKSIEIEPTTYRAKVALAVHSSCKLPTDSSAEIISESLLGGKYVTIVPGIGTTYIAVGGQIQRTVSAVNFESLISRFLLEGSKKADTEKR